MNVRKTPLFCLLPTFFVITLLALPAVAQNPHGGGDDDITVKNPQAAAKMEAVLLSGTRQLTFEGKRAGEGYFNADGSRMVFQSERNALNPFFQIYLLDLETGDTEIVSPGKGKTTCAWIHPDSNQVLFASTHDDADAVKKQQEELKLRASGKQRRYSWDYDEHFEMYAFNRKTKAYKNLTNVKGYDAEGSYSPDGKLIAFTSNRRAYEGEMTAEEKKNFKVDQAYMNDIYLMNADGTDVRRLTKAPGYDGGPFFSPDGKRICWRRFTPNGAIAEVWTMNVDGSDKRQITRLGSMSWAPYYHPSGKYLIFTTNIHGFSNFELYLIDTEGKSKPVRVTYTKGFDGLPVFTPDGKQLSWTTNRTSNKKSQIYMTQWDHEKALKLLGIDKDETAGSDEEARQLAAAARRKAAAGFSAQDVIRHVDYLCRKELQGRLTGTRGAKMATAYVAAYFDSLGLKPAGDDGTWFQQFEFTSGVALGEKNKLTQGDTALKLNRDWRPLSFSGTGDFKPAEVVFAGYGMQAPKTGDQDEYDSYVHLDVKDKWVMALRYMPEDVSDAQRQQLSRPSQLRFKATVARDRGAAGLIVVSGPSAKAKSQLVPLKLDGILAGSSLPVISITDDVAKKWLAASGKDLGALQKKLDTGALMGGFALKDVKVSASIDVSRVKSTGRNVLGRLAASDHNTSQAVIVGAHVDHLGKGASSSSLARDAESELIHYGADDNASGVAAMLEVAEYLADQKKQGKLNMQRDILFAAWSGEELGLLGSDHFVKNFANNSHDHDHAAHDHAHAPLNANPHAAEKPKNPHSVNPHAKPPAHAAGTKPAADNPHAAAHGKAHGHGHSHGPVKIYPAIAACVNMDMVGRLRKSLVLQGIGSSSIWRGEIERRNAPVGLPVTLQEDSYLPTDAKSFYTYGVPVISAFTGSHSEYHTPRDTPDTLNYEGTAKVARLMGLITRSLSMREKAPDFVQQERKETKLVGGGLRAYLGTIPDYAEEVKGVLLSGARKNGPADKAGVRQGDIIVGLAGKKIENIYDYTHAIEALKIGKAVKMIVKRGEATITLVVVPGSRE